MSQDTRLQLSVLAELEWEPSITAAHIGVIADAGVITLNGQVESYAQKHAAEAAAHRVKGVLAVVENLEVQMPFERKRGDKEIAAAIIDRLAWDVSVPRDAVQVRVEEGRVTLTGKVGWHYQREAAEQDVRRLHGVVGVSNQVTLKSRIAVANISNDISYALHRCDFPNPDAIIVTAEGGKVRLTGNVHSWHARQVAAGTAWGAPGTTDVENLLAVI
jgi:osmotically-inducible protein OsmY